MDVKGKNEFSMIEVMVSPESRLDLGRPKESVKENRVHFMETVLGK